MNTQTGIDKMGDSDEIDERQEVVIVDTTLDSGQDYYFINALLSEVRKFN